MQDISCQGKLAPKLGQNESAPLLEPLLIGPPSGMALSCRERQISAAPRASRQPLSCEPLPPLPARAQHIAWVSSEQWCMGGSSGAPRNCSLLVLASLPTGWCCTSLPQRVGWLAGIAGDAELPSGMFLWSGQPHPDGLHRCMSTKGSCVLGGLLGGTAESTALT